MHKHLSWILPKKHEQNLLTNSLSFQNKEILFSIPKSQKLTIQFKVNADFDSIGQQVFEFRFELKRNDENIFTSPSIKRKFRNSLINPFNQTLNIESSKVFDQNKDKYVVDIDVYELESSGAPTPTLQKTIPQSSSSIQSSPSLFSRKVDVNQIATPDHIFSPIRLKKDLVKLENLDQQEIETNEPILRESPKLINKIRDHKSESIQISDIMKEIESIEKENSKRFDEESTEINTILTPEIDPMNDIIMDSEPIEDKEIYGSDDESTKSATDSSSSSTPSSSFSSQSEKKKKKKKKKLSDLMKKIKKGQSLSESQSTNDLSKLNDHSISESQQTNLPQIIQEEKEKLEQSSESYCGLFNQGATCYMNSMLQAFYHLPAFRRLIYQMDTSIGNENEEKEKSIKNNIPLQLQKLFATMQTTKESACSTRDLTRSFGWTDADTIMQHDVQEFCRVLLDNLETKIDKQPQLKGSIQSLFRGKMRSFIRCTNVNFESKRDEYFYDLSLDVKGCRNLKESFYKYVESEKLNGKNQYDTGDPKFGKQDAVMGNEFIQFPPVLHLHLRRFEFNGNGMSKINSRFEFPLEINLGKFMAKDGEDRERQIYQLFGVLVHSGTVDGGHYYAFLRPTEKLKWYEFNDSSVSLSSIKDAVENNYGGSSNEHNTNDRFHPAFKNPRFAMLQRHQHQAQPQIHQRWFSAYMLIYIRRHEIPFLYKKVQDDEIPEEIKDLIQRQEEARRKKEEERRIQENTVVFHIFTLNDIGTQVSKTNKFCLPFGNDFSIGKKFTALRGEKYSVLYDKIMNDMIKENEKENENSFWSTDRQKISFEFWQFNSYSMGNKPIDLNKKIDFPSSQSLFLYFHDPSEEQKQKEVEEIEQTKDILDYPYILLFIFVYFPLNKHPISPLKVIKIQKQAPVKTLFDDVLVNNGLHCRSVFKNTQLQTLKEITDIDSSFDQNQIKNGSFIVFEPSEQPIGNQQNEEDEKQDESVKKYIEIYKPESVIEYFDIIRHMTSIKIIISETNILVNSSIEYLFFFPKNRTFQQFIQFIRFVLKIPEIRTIVLYETKSKTPLKYDKDTKLMDKSKLDSFSLFQFDFIAENVFQHSLLISFRIVGSFVDILDSTFNCWMSEDSTVADLTSYIESTYIIQLKFDYQNRLSRALIEGKDEFEDNQKEKIRQRVILNYDPSDGQNLRVFYPKREGLIVFAPDKKLSEIESNLVIDIAAEDQSVFELIISKELQIEAKQEDNSTKNDENQANNSTKNDENQENNSTKNDENQENSSTKNDENENKFDLFQSRQFESHDQEVTPPPSNDVSYQTLIMQVFISEKAMERICDIKDQGTTLISVFEGETMVSIKKRLSYLLNKEEEFFLRNNGKCFSFILMQNNSFFTKITPKENESLFVYLKKGYNKLRISLLLSEAGRTNVVSRSSSKDDSLVIKN